VWFEQIDFVIGPKDVYFFHVGVSINFESYKSTLLNALETNKYKIINDPIYGFIRLRSDLIFDLIEHPWYQRLRRISQLGLTFLVYPGAYHTRFHHTLGAMHLMYEAIDVLRGKGHDITPEEEEAAAIAILLHDIGHGPFSHALEHTIINGVSHEYLSLQFMHALNKQFNGQLSLAIQLFTNTYQKGFLHQLISSQLDVDRLDYLRRDSFYTGVAEGNINADRLVAMLNVKDDQLVVDAKGIYSVEKFIVARRLMYWQVYLHKTVLAAEFMLEKVLQRAADLYRSGVQVFATTALQPFFENSYSTNDFGADNDLLEKFAALDDYDIWVCIKTWQTHSDRVLASLSKGLIERKLLRIETFDKKPMPLDYPQAKRKAIQEKWQLTEAEAQYVVIHRNISNNAYDAKKHQILLLYRDGTTVDIAQAADQLNISALAQPVTKSFLCYPKDLMIL
jgi:uncharacterized protein